MRKDMYELGVGTENGLIRIDSRQPGDDEYGAVLLPVEQVDTLIQWLQEAKQSILEGKPD